MYLVANSLLDWLRTHVAASMLLVALSVVYIIQSILYRLSGQNRHPPGPWINLPFVGYLPFFEADPVKGFGRLLKKYGPIFKLQLGQQSVLVLGDFATVKEAFSNPAFNGRPPSPPHQASKYGTSITGLSGIAWLEQRRFTLHALRDLGFGKVRMETHIKEEISQLLEELDSFGGHATNVRHYLAPSVSNNVCALLIGRRLDYHDPMRLTLNWAINEYARNLGATSIHAWYPWIKPLLLRFRILNYDKLKEATEHLHKFLKTEIDNHKSSLDPNSARDYIDGYLLQIEQRQEKDPNTSFTNDTLIGNSISLLTAGSLTIRYTVEWTLLTMATYQDIQKRIYMEIKDVIGQERMPQWADHKEMPFTEAALMEIQRWKTVIPINLHRYTTEASEVGGYFIPKGTSVIANFAAVHNDSNHWDSPEVFNPCRFLSQDGSKLVKDEQLLSFSYGKRMCPGETLAITEVFLYVTSILQRFKVSFPANNVHNLEGRLGALYEPNTYQLRMIPREN